MANKYSHLACLLMLVLPAYDLAADQQPTPAPFAMPGTQVHTLTSTYNDVAYEVRVWLPEEYDGTGQRYPLTVLLDADYQFPLAVSILEHLAQRDQANQSIVVAIGYKSSARNPAGYRRNRTRDYTPTFVAHGGYGPEYQRLSGGAPAFLQFVSNEMMPYLSENYRITAAEHTFVGHSFGGLFGTYIIAENPHLFTNYILISPSLWYDDRFPINTATGFRSGHFEQPLNLYLAVGGYENQTGNPMIDELEMYATTLRELDEPQLQMVVRVFENETHASVYPIALSAAVRHRRSQQNAIR